MDDDRELDAELVERCTAGDGDAFGRLYDRWLDRVVDLARRIVGDDGAALDVAQDTFLKAHQSIEGLRDTHAFGGWLLRIARNQALDRQRSDRRAALVDGETMDVIERTGGAASSGSASLDVFDRIDLLEDPEQVAGDKEIAALVWGAASALGERDATVLDLHLRHGMEPAEIGEVVGVNRNAANQLVHRLRGRLERAVASRVLWRDGRPDCRDLADLLEAAGVRAFDQQAVRLAERHVQDCERCERRRAGLLAPAALFSSVPIVAVPQMDAGRIAAGLEAGGVPMAGSVHHGAKRLVTPRRVMMTAATTVVLAVAALLVGGGGSEEVDPMSAAGTPSTTTSTSTTSTSTMVAPTTAPTTAPTSGDDTPAAPGGDVVPPALPPPSPPEATVSASVSPASVPTTYPMISGNAPTVSWTTGGAPSVSVAGPGLSSTSPSGSQLVCPGDQFNSTCTVAPGVYSYTVTATNAAGQVTQQTVSFTA